MSLSSAPMPPLSPLPLRPVSSLATANLICMASMMIWAAGLPSAERLFVLLPSDQLAALRMAQDMGRARLG